MSNTKSQFSEFTYGFALTRELLSGPTGKFLHAPKFPSLREEGKAGYDVRMGRKGKPLFIQFKLSEPLLRGNAKEARKSKFRIPCYRMHFWSRVKSDQHKLLLDLEQTNRGGVFYYAPAFWQAKVLDRFFNVGQIQGNSRRARPLELAIPIDSKSHHFSFELAIGGKTQMFSDEPEERHLDERPLQEVLISELATSDTIPLAENLSKLESWFIHSEVFEPDQARTASLLISRAQGNWLARLDRLASWTAIHLNSTLFILQEPES